MEARFDLVTLSPPVRLRDTLAADVRQGFARKPKELPPKYFYDVEGSGIFERITDLPEYYVTRAEARAIGGAVADLSGSGWRTVLELGSGSSSKTRAFLDLVGDLSTSTYVPFDISDSAINDAARSLLATYQELRIEGYVGDFLTPDLETVLRRSEPKVVLFLGSTLGNLDEPERRGLYRRIATNLAPTDAFLFGIDLIKDAATIEAAYNDSEGVTADFNMNVLRVLKRELGASIDLADFRHSAPYVADLHRIEMRLYAERDLNIRFDSHGLPDYEMKAGEYILTELSIKFDVCDLEKELIQDGLRITNLWTDPNSLVGVCLAGPAT